MMPNNDGQWKEFAMACMAYLTGDQIAAATKQAGGQAFVCGPSIAAGVEDLTLPATLQAIAALEVLGRPVLAKALHFEVHSALLAAVTLSAYERSELLRVRSWAEQEPHGTAELSCSLITKLAALAATPEEK